MMALRFRTEGSPAPGDLVVVQGFLNTWSDELEIEDLANPADTENWLRQAGLWKGRSRLGVAQHQSIVELRSCLRSCILNDNGFGPLAKMTSSLRFGVDCASSGQITFVPGGNSYEKAIGALVATIITNIHKGTWNRLKCCALPSCGWAFYDTTRSHTRRWCSMRTCGSRHKSREYYKRKTSGQGSGR
jgi:predicted RNA-binding Zn ribbon-like protein